MSIKKPPPNTLSDSACGIRNTNESATHDAEKRETPPISRAARRKAKKAPVVVTSQMREEAKERRRELRRHLRMLKSNGARRKLAKLRAEKRSREVNDVDEVCARLDVDARPLKKGRRE